MIADRENQPMRKLDFIGTVQGTTFDLGIPGRDALFLKPEAWPKQLVPGILTIEVKGFPARFDEIGTSDGLRKLDEGKCRPALVIPQRLIAGSTLKPDSDHPTRGFALVWQADLQVIATSQEISCWAIRIIGSDSTSVLGLVAEEDLRNRMNLADGMEVKVTVWEEESNRKLPTPKENITNWCEATRTIKVEFGTENALKYLIGEKFLDFLAVAERDEDFRVEVPTFVAEVKDIFEQYEIADYLERARHREPFDPADYEDDDFMDQEDIEMERKQDIRDAARDLLLIEQAREWLLDER